MSFFSNSDISWQSILDSLTHKAKKDGLILSVQNAKGFEAKISKVRDSIVIRNKLATWISICAEVQHSKSGSIATKLRDEGNLRFQHHDNERALQLYGESVICAPEYGPELSMAYGNRSAALYHLGLFKDCLQDISLSLKYRYPKNLEYKLHQRRGLCMRKLGKCTEAIESFERAIESIKYIHKLTDAKRSSLTKDLNTLITETTSVMRNSPSSQTQSDIQSTPPELPSLGLHKQISGASSVLQLREDPSKGRHIVINEDVKIGTVLFSEMPYSSVLLPEHSASHCHHCYKQFRVAIPCLKCTQPRYCSEDCRIDSWEIYHQFECGNLDLLYSVGIAHLALRTVLQCGFSKLADFRSTIQSQRRLTGSAPDSNGYVDRYPDVFNLVSHVQDLNPEDLFQYAVTACLLTTSLERRSKFFFGSNNQKNVLPDEVCEDLCVFVAGVILKHVTQLVCNASAIYEVGTPSIQNAMDDNFESSGRVVESSQFRIAVALYPGASLMNHSCDPSVINSFFGARLIVRAIKDLSAGDEVYNCYGPHFRRHSLQERKDILSSQYHFQCDCEPCKQKDFQELEDRYSALKCHFCEGPIRNPTSAKSLEHRLPCCDCGKEQEYSDRIEVVFMAYELFKKGMDNLKIGSISEAISAFQSCYQMRREAMFALHHELIEVADQLARCYCLIGSYCDAARYIKVCLPAVEERFGKNSIELGHELLKYIDVLTNVLQDPRSRDRNAIERLTECQSVMERCAEIFELHYGTWNDTYKEVVKKLEETKLIAAVRSGLEIKSQF